jgi:hypothetical protein
MLPWGNLRPYLIAEYLEHDVVELFCVVDCDCSWDVKAVDDVLLENFFIVAELMLVIDFTSIHLVKYSIATMAKV